VTRVTEFADAGRGGPIEAVNSGGSGNRTRPRGAQSGASPRIPSPQVALRHPAIGLPGQPPSAGSQAVAHSLDAISVSVLTSLGAWSAARLTPR
jgi:hypothetical protein